MKFASYKDGSRDGQLVVVSRDLTQAHYATHIANRLQQVLDDWNFLAPQLQELYNALNSGHARHAFAFDPAQCLAPLPRAYQWADSTAYPRHMELLHPNVPAALQVRHHAGDALVGPLEPIVCTNPLLGLDFEAQVAVVTGDLPAGCAPDRALDGVRLLALANHVCQRNNQGAAQYTAFSPVAVTPDELGEAWARGRVQLTLHTAWNGRKVGLCDAGADMAHHFGHVLAHLCQGHAVRAGSIVGSGPVSNKVASKGYNCIAEKRTLETAQDGQPSTEYLRVGDTVRVEMKTREGQSVFGVIEQEVVAGA
jgi:fumarylacetoacetate (FAA) hydrolase